MRQMFNYDLAFSRNIGWVTKEEQRTLARKRVAIGGLGGVGGSHLLTLIRLGITDFHIADFDVFELANFNRQAGASMRSLGQSKARVMVELAQQINPEARIRVFAHGITIDTIADFLEGVDLYVDGLDFFAFDAREAIFKACSERAVPATTVAPLGMGAALLNFLPGGTTFEQYFRLAGKSEDEKALRFLVGLAPALLQRSYLADPSAVNLLQQRGPSTVMACELCAGIAGTEALKILLKRRKVFAAPHGVQFDAYRNRAVHTWRPGGNNNPLQRLMLAIARKHLNDMACKALSS